NTLIGIAAGVITALLALKIEGATAEAYEARSQRACIGRVAILCELTASIGYQGNQPPAGTGANGNACPGALGGGRPRLEEARRALENIVKDANRASGIIARLRAMTQRAPAKMISVDINEIIRDTLALSEGEIESHRIMVQMDLAGDLPKLKGDPVQLQQV